ncbi:hypothetical protein [Tolypothrix bouteillei]|uniref:hypothetical protein n=1 Tax=Tolypothrix bouteillei TaxID=1246981 RepID=UPI0014367F9E|nr:hypothetical protein [Tolypothrix bouteillei]
MKSIYFLILLMFFLKVFAVSIATFIFSISYANYNIKINPTIKAAKNSCQIWVKMNEKDKLTSIEEIKIGNYLYNSQLQSKREKFQDFFQKEKLQMV